MCEISKDLRYNALNKLHGLFPKNTDFILAKMINGYNTMGKRPDRQVLSARCCLICDYVIMVSMINDYHTMVKRDVNRLSLMGLYR